MSLEYPCVYYENEQCKKFSVDGVTSWCVQGPCDEQKMSEADRIRAMSDEELGRLLKDRGCPPDQPTGGCTWGVPCEYCWRCWLQQPAEAE